MRYIYDDRKKKNKIIFTRTFSAPINKVFDAYTKRELFEQWFHPQDASVTVYDFNATKGGNAFMLFKLLR